MSDNYNSQLDAISKIVYVAILYNLPRKKTQYYGVIRSGVKQSDTRPNRPEEKDGHYIFWDIVTNSWLDIPYIDTSTCYYTHLDTLENVTSPRDLLNLDRFEAEAYNDLLSAEVRGIVNRFDEFIESESIELADSERLNMLSLQFRELHSSGGNLPLSTIPKIIKDRGSKTINEIVNIARNYNVHTLECTLAFKCKFTPATLIKGKLTKKQMKVAREVWMDRIREYREVAFEELDQLEDEARKEGSSEEDLKDVDTIKQMFRDIPTDVNLDQYTTLSELVKFWPSLLLPAPDIHSHIIGKEHKMYKPLSQEDILTSLLNQTTSIDDLEQLLKNVSHLEGLPEYAIPAVHSRIAELKK